MFPNERLVGNVNLDIGNAGASIKVLDTDHGPEIVIFTGAFGNLESQLKLKTDRQALENLGALFMKAAQGTQRYAEPYCHALRGETGRNFGMPMGGMETLKSELKKDLEDVAGMLKKAD